MFVEVFTISELFLEVTYYSLYWESLLICFGMFITSHWVCKRKIYCIMTTSDELGDEGFPLRAAFIKESNETIEPNL